MANDGTADLRYLETVAHTIGQYLDHHLVIVQEHRSRRHW